MTSGPRRPRRRVVLAALAVLLAGGWWTLEAMTGEPLPWVEAERGDLAIGVELSGTLQAVKTSLLGPPSVPNTWQFKIAFMAPEGEDVQAGQPVLGFDTSEFEQKLQVQMAEAQEARKRIEKVETEMVMKRRENALRLAEAQARRRKAQLVVEIPGELSKALELEQARLDLELADKELAHLESRVRSSEAASEAYLAALRDQRDRAEQQVAASERAIAQMQVGAPREGTVIYVQNWRGEKKKVGDACWQHEQVLEVPDLEQMKARGQVHEADAGKLVDGQRVRLRLDAHPDLEFTGRVSSIWRTVQRESWRTPLKIVRLEIELDETDRRKMRPGMRFRGQIETGRVEQAVLVPVEAIHRSSGRPVVYRHTWLGYEAVPVELGRRNDARVEVVSGLAEGDRVSLIDPTGPRNAV